MQPIAGRITGLSWSPDGQTIAYCLTAVSGVSGLFTVPADSGQSRIVVADSGVVGPISWAPDSKRIVFTMRRPGGANIYITDLAGNIRRITSHAGTDTAPSWSRDGTEIVFSSNISGQSEIWLKSLETGSLRRLTTDGDNEYPAFSPDRKRVAWSHNEGGLRLFDRTTGHIEEIAAPKIVFFSPAWSPDGKFIAITAGDWGKVDVYLVTADGGNALILTKSANTQMGIPSWSPDGRSIAVAVNARQKMTIDIVNEIAPYKSRLESSMPIRVFPPVTQRDDFR